jgi:CRISPR-associated endoribonuclease Cas6
MELTLKFGVCSGSYLPINYQYELSSWIYKVIERADAQYADFLHNQGFQLNGKRFKMFTFSQLDARPYQVEGNRIRLLGKEISLTLRFAVDSSIDHFIKGLFLQQRFGLGDKYDVVDFEVIAVGTIAPPVFHTTMTYQCLSPICVSRARDDRTAEYLSPETPGYGGLLVQNLVRKSGALISATESYSQDLPDFQFRLLNTPRKKGTHIKAQTESHTQVIGYLFHFRLTVPVELHELGYDAGFGEKNSMGFGCVANG